MTFDRIHILFAALLFAAACSPPKKSSYVTVDGFAMGTTWSVQLELKGEPGEASDIRTLVSASLENYEERMSTWREHTVISKFNGSSSTNWFQGDVHIMQVLLMAQGVSQASGGAFDITVQPLVELWGFGSGEEITNAPSTNILKNVMTAVGSEKLLLKYETFEFRKAHPDTQIDVSALAKGFAVDQVSLLLKELLNYTNHLVEIGGELRGHGLSPKGRAWRVGLELPVVGESQIGGAVDLSNQSLATSGDYRNFIVLDGKRHAHIIDPRTGYPIEQKGVAVSVLAPTCMEADAWATALTVLGLEEGLKMAEKNNITAHFSLFKGNDLVQRSTSRWPMNP